MKEIFDNPFGHPPGCYGEGPLENDCEDCMYYEACKIDIEENAEYLQSFNTK
jgi:hypothetical protein